MIAAVDAKGFAIFEGFCENSESAELQSIFSTLPDSPGKRFAGHDPEIEGLTFIERLDLTAASILGENGVRVRAIFFQKSAERNWLVPWHQDVTRRPL